MTADDETRYFYRLPPVIRPYVERSLADEQGREAMLRRFGEAYAELAAFIYNELTSGRAIAWLALQCYDDLEHGVSFVEGPTQEYYLLHWGWILHWLGDPHAGMVKTEQALELAEGHNRLLEGQIFHNLAMISHATGQTQKALRLNEQALLIRREVGDRSGEGATLNNLGRVYNALGQKQQALDFYQQALQLAREVGDRSGEGITLHNIGMIYAHFRQFDVALACALLAKALFEYVQSPYAENERQQITTLRTQLGEQQFATLFAQVEHQANEMVERALQEKMLPVDGVPLPSTLPTEHLSVLVSNTIAVVTIMPEHLAEWRETIAEALADAEQRGTDWQIEVDFYTAILAILDGQAPSLPADHPYAASITAIQEGIARGGPISDDEDDGSEEEQALLHFVQMSVAALQSKDAQEKMAFMQQLATLQAQAPDDEMKAQCQALQLALQGGDLTHLGETLTGLARQLWDAVVAGMRQDNIPPDDPSDTAA